MSRVVGIDLGGTAIKHGLVESGRILSHAQKPTPAGGGEDVLEALVDIVREYASTSGIDAVGVGTAGAVDFEHGTVVGHSPNIPRWAGMPVAERMTRRLQLPVRVDNDANCMALAESARGAGRGARSVFFLTLGTGVGSAFVVDGRLWRGAHSLGGEYGHAAIVKDGRLCSCGQRGHLEAYASATALVRRAIELGRGDARSKWAAVDAEAFRAIGSREIFEAARQGDPASAQAIEETASYLATGIASAVNLLDPERVVIGGGMADAGDAFFAAVTSEVRSRVHAALVEWVQITRAELGNQAGLLGAAMLLDEPLPS